MLILEFHSTVTEKKILLYKILNLPQYHILFKSIIQQLVDRQNDKTRPKLLAQISYETTCAEKVCIC